MGTIPVRLSLSRHGRRKSPGKLSISPPIARKDAGPEHVNSLRKARCLYFDEYRAYAPDWNIMQYTEHPHWVRS